MQQVLQLPGIPLDECVMPEIIIGLGSIPTDKVWHSVYDGNTGKYKAVFEAVLRLPA